MTAEVLPYRSDGQVAYDAYCVARGGFSVSGEKLPAFKDQSDSLRLAWEIAAAAVVAAYLEREEEG